MKNKLTINYVCEVSYPNSSAYGIHVLKMCDAFAKKNKVNLFCPYSALSFKKLKKDYSLKNKTNLNKMFDKKVKLNLISRLIYSTKILFYTNEEINKTLFLSRSVVFGILASLLQKNIILEIHHELSGVTKKIYYFLKYFGFLNNLKYIFIHKNLINKFTTKINNNYLCLDDAVDIKDFVFSKYTKKRNTCVYVGSFHFGKGVELILRMSKKLKNINFHLYGDKKFLDPKSIPKNVKIFNYIKYNNIPSILSKYHVALMPYGDVVSGRLININLVNSMSPMKMFDYLASGNIILASKLKVYGHILKHKKNSILIQNSKLNMWIEYINMVFKNLKKYENLKKNAIKTAKGNTWLERSKKIINLSKI